MLALVYGLKRFRHYLYRIEILIYSDHHPLVWLQQHKDNSSRLTRWALQLQEYNVTIRYKAGKRNTNADALSRIPHGFINPIYTTNSNLDCLGVLQKEDKNLSEINDVITNNNTSMVIQKSLRKHLRKR